MADPPVKKRLSLARRRRPSGPEGGSQSLGGESGGGKGVKCEVGENVGVGVAMGWDKEEEEKSGGVAVVKVKKKQVKKRMAVIDSDDEMDFGPAKKKQIRQRKPMEIEEDDFFEGRGTKKVRKTVRKSSSSSRRRVQGGGGRSDDEDDFVGASEKTGSARVIRKAPKVEMFYDDDDEDCGRGSSLSRGRGRGGRKVKEEEEEPVHKWWLEKNRLKEGQKWRTLEHNGVLFPPLYVPHGIPLLYDGEEVTLTPKQEEYATYYAQYLETDHVKKPAFRKNFWRCWERMLNPKRGVEPHIISDFEKIDFRPIWKHLEEKREAKRERSKEEREEEKKERERLAEIYGVAIVDGVKERVGNYRIEPPGLFLGRGMHPKTGMFKARLTPRDITINIGEGCVVPTPPAPYDGVDEEGKKWEWGEVVHNDSVGWLAMWKENISMSTKYVMLHTSSRLKGEADMRKFEIARKLKGNVQKIRASYTKDLSSTSSLERQLATAMWVIDRLALRVGNEKGGDEADTVGCCSLRVEHITLIGGEEVEFDFLAKDSMRYFNRVKVDPKVYDNFKRFTKGKKKGEDIFHLLTTTELNSHLKTFMEGLSAKVFRTYNASFTLQEELKKVKFEKYELLDEKLQAFNRANREVAILCNHQRTVSKTHHAQMEKLDQAVDDIREEIQLLRQYKKRLREGVVGDEEPPMKRKRGSDDEEAKPLVLPKTEEKCEVAIDRLNERLKKWEIKRVEKDELKTISLSTSKVNYIDPRLTVAWCKRNEIPVDKIFSKALRQKFVWAMDTDPDWVF